MDNITLILIALGLAMDAFAVAVAASLPLDRLSVRRVFRLAFHFGLFQALMPILGWLAGRRLGSYLDGFDHWIAFGLLTFIGTKAIVEAVRDKGGVENRGDATRGMTMVGLSIATSIDALAVGISLAMLRVDIWYPCAVIGVVACVLTAIGMLLGKRLGAIFGRRIEILGGLILIGIGTKILLQ